MSKLINIIGVSIFFIFLLVPSVFCEEAISITTYYPSPYGSYNELTTAGNTYLAVTSGSVGIGTASPAGKLDVNGTIYQRGGVLHADYVFEPGYELENIEEHAEYMWQNKHLKAVPKALKDESGQDIVEYGVRMRGILEELEKAHVYIQRLNERIKVLEMEINKS